MSTDPAPRVRTLSLVLVGLQFALITALLLPPASLVPRHLADVPGALCLLGSGALFIAAFLAMRRRNFTVLPEPRAGATLITHGPYAVVRHPMYTAVLLGGLGSAWIANSWPGWLQFVPLVIVMVLKQRHEERLLIEAHPGYARYRTHTSALVPSLY